MKWDLTQWSTCLFLVRARIGAARDEEEKPQLTQRDVVKIGLTSRSLLGSRREEKEEEEEKMRRQVVTVYLFIRLVVLVLRSEQQPSLLIVSKIE